MDFLYRPPIFLRQIFPGIIWDNFEDSILLTIDDGPSDDTFRILDSLDKFNLKAIFFCTGKNIEKHFNEFNAIIKSGHSVQNHGYNHKRMILRDKKYNYKEIDRTNKIINDMTGKAPGMFRPPYGLFNNHTIGAVNKYGMKMMLWSLLTGDHTGDFAHVRRLTDSYITKNSIIVMHDNKKSSIIFDKSLEYIVKFTKERKYEFTLSGTKSDQDKK